MKRKLHIITVVLVSVLLMTGCGSKKNEYIELGMDAVAALDYHAALEQFAKAQEAKENQVLVYRGMGLAYMGLIQYEEAVNHFLLALEHSKGSVGDLEYDINYYLAASYYKMGQLQEAADAYSAILALRPKEKNAFYLRGVVLLGAGYDEDAVKDFEKAISLDTKDYTTYIDVYTCLAESGYRERGETYLQAALTDEKALSNYDRGRIYYYLGNYSEARVSLEKALSEKGTEEVTLLLGKTYEALTDHNYAIGVYERFLEKNTNSALVNNQLGLCRMNQQDYEGALAAFQAGMNTENAAMLQILKFNEIVVYEYLRDFTKASVLMQDYMTTYPDDTEAVREYEFLRTR